MLDHIAASVAVILMSLERVPQIIKVYRTKLVDGLSLPLLLNGLVCAVAWLVHGLCIQDGALIWGETILVFTTLTAIIQKFKYTA